MNLQSRTYLSGRVFLDCMRSATQEVKIKKTNSTCRQRCTMHGHDSADIQKVNESTQTR